MFIQSSCFLSFKERTSPGTFQYLLSNIAYTIWKIILKSLNYVQCLNIAHIEKAKFMMQMEYSPNGKGIMALREYSLVVYIPNGKGMVL